MSKRALVAGAGGFIGGYLVKRLQDEGYYVRAVDIKPCSKWHQWHGNMGMQETWGGTDLREIEHCQHACEDVNEVYNLAADMGGMGFIESHKYECMQSVLINTNLLNAAIDASVSKYFFSSSACVYPGYIQNQTDPMYRSLGKVALSEKDAYPADPEDGYGWEKLFSERMCRHAYEDRGLEVRIARYHNVYGPHGTWTGGREKAPAALCRKVAELVHTGRTFLDIWGDGNQTRSFMYIDDCIEGTRKLMESNWTDPINLGSSELISINQLADMILKIAGWNGHPGVHRVHDLDAPQGVRGRNSDNTLIKQVLRWEPSITLDAGLRETYSWIYDQVVAAQP